jgi:hypothetical protein
MNRPWGLGDAAKIALYVKQDAWAAGYIVGIYGSVLKGLGRDCDLMAVPWRPKPDPEALILAVEHTADAVHHPSETDNRDVLHGKRSIILTTKRGPIDLAIYPAPESTFAD